MTSVKHCLDQKPQPPVLVSVRLEDKVVTVKDVMTADPMTVKLTDPIDACMGLMATRNFRHLPAVEAGSVVGVVSIGDVVKDNIRQMGQQIYFLETYIKGHGV